MRTRPEYEQAFPVERMIDRRLGRVRLLESANREQPSVVVFREPLWKTLCDWSVVGLVGTAMLFAVAVGLIVRAIAAPFGLER